MQNKLKYVIEIALKTNYSAFASWKRMGSVYRYCPELKWHCNDHNNKLLLFQTK